MSVERSQAFVAAPAVASQRPVEPGGFGCLGYLAPVATVDGSFGAVGCALTGVCPDAADRLVHKSEIAAFRLYASPANVFVQVGETPYDGYSDVVNIVAAP